MNFQIFHRQFFQVFPVIPVQSFHIENAGALLDSFQRKFFNQLVFGKNFSLIARIPADKSDKIYYRFRQITYFFVFIQRCRPVPFGKLGTVGAQYQRQVGVIGNIKSQRFL